ncbi:MAG: threonylcarbamoyl-AMP synthase [Oscillospiraceae bacterium]|nr:threonylcarbamoyl-AMP synthase [Oscillospiraceae bacterium]
MKTRVFTDKEDLAPAAEMLKGGGLVAVPTETVYGLCVNGLDERAVAALYEAKGRPEVKPLSLMIPGAGAMDRYALDIPPQAYTLSEKFWPGPLTIVLRTKEIIPPITLSGGQTVGLRCPDHPMTLALLEKAGIPLAGPSANPSGRPSPKTAAEVLGYFDGRIDAVLDGGPCGIGRESTIIDMSDVPYRTLRRGALPDSEIDEALLGAMRVIGLTGGSGSGKTTAMKYLVERGALGIDCDEVYHRLLRECRPMLDEIRDRFPDAFPGGVFDRKALGRIVFADGAALTDLNKLTHRYVREEVRRLLRGHARMGGTLAAVDAVELIDGGLGELCSFTVGVVADRKARAARIMAREGIGEEYALSRIDAQKSDEYYERHCDHVLHNDGTREELHALCRELFGI